MRHALTLSVLIATTTAAAASPDLSDRHLDLVPRTAEEADRIAAVIPPTDDFSAPEAFEANSAGAATVTDWRGGQAFSQPSATLSSEETLDFAVGNGLFRKHWVPAPASTKASDGLGPLFNARACQQCHLHDGRGHPPEPGDTDRVSMVLKLSVPAPGDAALAEIEAYLAALDGSAPRTRPDPSLGSQLQDRALPGMDIEARWDVTYEESPVILSGGETVSLRRPTYHIDGVVSDGLVISPRVAPQMIGLGLLEAIPAQDILAHEDPDDRDGDGISGRAQIVWSQEYDAPMLGRFGLKAGMPTVRAQAAQALSTDIGISSPLHPDPAGDCTPRQTACRNAPHGDGDARHHEIDAAGLDLITFYSRNLAVPARRAVGDPEVLRGKQVFYETGCPACHVPKFVTHRLSRDTAQSYQLIWPYTDLLLHDMGEGLADHRPEGRASGREWRTPPLWGIGLTQAVSGHSYFLHDGRARSLLEAVLWHGGEAEPARTRVVEMPPADRAALITYLESL
ncbi:di-heme oxidoredictase family protein [Tropicibacter sp. S64]|uniref:di-heme oxidoreductase family protein n=1 Tax=Tropicibacter sp. S64 TaxID=3415122 RepID=UPI003C7C223B